MRYYKTVKKRKEIRSSDGGRFWIWSTFILIFFFIGSIYFFTRNNHKPEDVQQNKIQQVEGVDTSEITNANITLSNKNTNKSTNSNSNKNINSNINKSPTIKAYIALIIDDLGNIGPETEPVKSLLNIKYPITLSVIPERPNSAEIAKTASEKGFEILIHQPMEPINPTLSAGEGSILSNMTDPQISQMIQKHISEMPSAIGMNNHMGSKVTQDEELMRVIMKELKRKNLFFIDSMTISTSKGFAVAQEEKIKSGKRTYFIDGQDDEVYIHNKIMDMANEALEKRIATPIGIGHIRTKTINVIKNIIPELLDMGVGIKKISEVVK